MITAGAMPRGERAQRRHGPRRRAGGLPGTRVLYYIILYCIVYIILYHIILHNIILYYIILYYHVVGITR